MWLLFRFSVLDRIYCGSVVSDDFLRGFSVCNRPIRPLLNIGGEMAVLRSAEVDVYLLIDSPMARMQSTEAIWGMSRIDY